jgi:hypothetical protein
VLTQGPRGQAGIDSAEQHSEPGFDDVRYRP